MEAVGGSVVAVVLGAVAVMLGPEVLGALSAMLGSGEAFGAGAASLVAFRSLSVVEAATLAGLDALCEDFTLVFVEARGSFGVRGLLGAAAGAGGSMATLVLALSLPLSPSAGDKASGALVSVAIV